MRCTTLRPPQHHIPRISLDQDVFSQVSFSDFPLGWAIAVASPQNRKLKNTTKGSCFVIKIHFVKNKTIHGLS